MSGEFDFGPGLRLEERIDAAEGEGIEARWEFGKWMLGEIRPGKRNFDDGWLDALVAATHKDRRELQYRRQFAERYPEPSDLRTAVHEYSSWSDIRERGLVREPRPPAETPSLPPGEFSTIVADPPWDIRTPPNEFGGSGSNRPLDYPTLGIDAIAALEVKDRAAPDSCLYLWTVNAHIENAYRIAGAWGFEPSTLLVWCKAPHGIGQGGTHVLTTEYVLFARRGSLAHRDRVDRSWFDWPRGAHSEKPAQFFDLVERLFPGPYLELFARREREGWESWGDEVVDAVAA